MQFYLFYFIFRGLSKNKFNSLSALRSTRRSNGITGLRSTCHKKLPSSAALGHDTVAAQITDENAPPVAQCGMCAAEMLSGSLGALHAINLFVVGMFTWLPSVSQYVDFVPVMLSGFGTTTDRDAFNRRASIS